MRRFCVSDEGRSVNAIQIQAVFSRGVSRVEAVATYEKFYEKLDFNKFGISRISNMN